MTLGAEPLLAGVLPREVYLTFIASLDRLASQRLVNQLIGALAERYSIVHLLLQSEGGDPSEGIFLHNFLKEYPADLRVYNIGRVASAATTAYLGARHRVVAPTGAFMLHRCHATFQGANAGTVRARSDSLELDDKRSEVIFDNHLTLTPEQKAVYSSNDLWLSAQDALDVGLAHEFGLFSPPAGARILNAFTY